MKEIENPSPASKLSDRQIEVMEIYLKFNRINSHKMNPIPIYMLNR